VAATLSAADAAKNCLRVGVIEISCAVCVKLVLDIIAGFAKTATATQAFAARRSRHQRRAARTHMMTHVMIANPATGHRSQGIRGDHGPRATNSTFIINAPASSGMSGFRDLG
jgi:hypothetical protein